VPAGERSWIMTDQCGIGAWHGEPDAKEGTRLDEITTLAYSVSIGQDSSQLIPSMQIMAKMLMVTFYL